MPDSKRQLRATMRAKRRNLSHRQQHSASRALAAHLSRQIFFARARHIAFYLPNDGEIDPTFLLRQAVADGKNAYLPVLETLRGGVMSFLQWQPGDPLKTNRYGIPEPCRRKAQRRPLWMLDIICLPLVAFDNSGKRLGMGGGYYDRTLATLGATRRHKPRLIGLAHHFQQTLSLPSDPWDIPLNGVATDQSVTLFPTLGN